MQSPQSPTITVGCEVVSELKTWNKTHQVHKFSLHLGICAQVQLHEARKEKEEIHVGMPSKLPELIFTLDLVM